MAPYIISCCSTSDLTPEHLAKRDISYICFHFSLDGKQYVDDLGKSISYEEFYQAMENGAETKTSQVNPDEFLEYFTPFLEQGKDILHVSLSSGLSGVYNAAKIAQDILAEKFPERKVHIVDSLGASSGYGLLMDALADKRDAGMDIDQACAWAEEHKLEAHHWFFSTDLTYFVRGGRISRVAGWFGTALKICPLLNMNDQGKLIPRLKLRGKEKAIKEIVQKMRQHAKEGLEYCGKCFLSHAYCYEDAKAVAALVEKSFPKLQGKVEIFSVGTTIGSHTGPGTVALFFWGDMRGE